MLKALVIMELFLQRYEGFTGFMTSHLSKVVLNITWWFILVRYRRPFQGLVNVPFTFKYLVETISPVG